MKVVDSTKTPDSVAFRDLPRGETYCTPRGAAVFLKAGNTENGDMGVRLYDGSIYKHKAYTVVVPISATVYVGEPK